MSEEPEAGRVIAGRYEIVRRLGAGGMGAVYQARQLSMDRMVAVKLIHAHIASRPEVAARFHREMQATSRIEHPSTIQVFDYGATDDGQLFLAMEYLEGRPLSTVIADDGPLPTLRILHIVRQITRALGAAHAEGIVHRDLKPDNVMVVDRYGERDVVKVLDFGIARFVEGDEVKANMTAEGALIGTPAYMSPEQALGRPLDVRTDFYSLGVMTYELAMGRPPFEATTLAGFLLAHASEEPPVPSTVAPGRVVPRLEALILRLLAKSPDARPANAAEVLALLDDCETPTAAVSTHTPPARSSHVAWVALALVIVAAGASVEWARRARAARIAQARDNLDALLTIDGDPSAPATCRATDPALVDRMTRAAILLKGSTFGVPRPQDQEALTLLGAASDTTAAETLALIARAQLVTASTDAPQTAQLAATLCPDFALAYNLVGNAERKTDPKAADAAFHRALELAPDYLAPRVNLGILATQRADFPAALKLFDDVLARNPQHVAANQARTTVLAACRAQGRCE